MIDNYDDTDSLNDVQKELETFVIANNCVTHNDILASYD